MRGWFSRAYDPVETVEPGGSVSFHVPNAGWFWDARVEPERPEGAGHALHGPIEVRGARAGQTLVVRIDEVVPRDWGRTWADGETFTWLLAGDGHGAQGDGEVSGTAIECPLERVTLTLRVEERELRSPIARTADSWLAFAFDEDLDAAAHQATETMLDLMEHELGATRREALALASVAVDLHVTQVVNEVKGVHAVLRDDAIR